MIFLLIARVSVGVYSIGLCHHSVRHRPKRSVINKPLIITMVLIIQSMMRIVSNTTDNKLIILLTGDVGHLIGIKGHFNITGTLVSIMILLFQMVYYYNHRIGVKPTFIRVIQVLSGSITPSSVGLNNSTQVKQLLKIAKWQPLLKKNNTILLPLIGCISNTLDFTRFHICSYLFHIPSNIQFSLGLLSLQSIVNTNTIILYSM